GEALLAKVVEEDGVDRLAVVEALFEEDVVGVADGHEVSAVQARHRRQLVVARQLAHVVGELAAVDLVAPHEAEAGAEDEAAGPVVVVADRDANRLPGEVADVPLVLVRPAASGGSRRGAATQPLAVRTCRGMTRRPAVSRTT